MQNSQIKPQKTIFTNQMESANLAIFASGTGTNAGRIIEYFNAGTEIKVVAIFTNKTDAGVIALAGKYKIPIIPFSRNDFYEEEEVIKKLRQFNITHIVLAGFLWKVPLNLLHAYKNRIINIHPALLPKYGGKGMYGTYVHKAVKDAGEKETGITIHLVNENYDEGKYLYQQKIALTGNDTIEEIANRVRMLEHDNYAREIERWIRGGDGM